MIFQNELIQIEQEPSEIPWLKIFIKRQVKEFGQCSDAEKTEIFRTLAIVETQMLAYFKADKINIASLGNITPQVHWHIMARFKNDSFFPQPIWGIKQREAKLQLPSFELFFSQLATSLAC